MQARFLAAIAASAFLAGCTTGMETNPITAESHVTAIWEGPEHLHVIIRNAGETGFTFAPQALTVTGPSGTIPLFLKSAWGTPTVPSGGYIDIPLHARSSPEGQWGLSIDTVYGEHEPAAPGVYTVCLWDHCTEARLE